MLSLMLPPVGLARTGAPSGASGGSDSPARTFLLRPVAGPGVEEAAVDRIAAYVETLLSIDDRFELLPSGQMDRGSRGDKAKAASAEVPRDKAIEEADKNFWKARELIEQGQLRRATGVLKGVIRTYAQRFEYMEDFSQLIEAVYDAAVTFHASGHAGLSKTMLQILYTLRPDTVFDRRKVPEGFMGLADRVRDDVASKPGGTMRITTRPAGARVLVDGVDHGASPVEISLEVAGTHFVVARLPGYRPAGERVRVPTRGSSKKVKLKLRKLRTKSKEKRRHKRNVRLEDIAPLIETGNFDRTLLGMLRVFAKQGRADFIAIAHVGRSGPQLVYSAYLYSAADDVVVPAGMLKVQANLANLQIAMLPTPDRFASTMRDVRRSEAVKGVPRPWRAPAHSRPPRVAVGVTPVPSPRPRPPAPTPVVTPAPNPSPRVVQPAPPIGPITAEPEDEDSSIFSKWWFWAATAAVVGGGVAAAVLLSDSGSSSTTTFRANVNWPSRQ